MMKVCKKCGGFKNYSEYYNQKNYKDGLDPMCKDCRNETSREYQKKHKERLREYRKDWSIKNKEKKKKTEFITRIIKKSTVVFIQKENQN